MAQYARLLNKAIHCEVQIEPNAADMEAGYNICMKPRG